MYFVGEDVILKRREILPSAGIRPKACRRKARELEDLQNKVFLRRKYLIHLISRGTALCWNISSPEEGQVVP